MHFYISATYGRCASNSILSIDILASKVVFTNHVYYEGSSRSRQPSKGNPTQFTSTRKGDIMLTATQAEHYVEVQGGPGPTASSKPHRTDSQERIIDNGSSRTPTSVDIDLDTIDPKRNGISKTVEFEVYENDRRIR